MALEQQIKALDHLLRNSQSRAQWRQTQTLPEDLAKAGGSLTDDDRAVLTAMDGPRLQAFADYMADKVVRRFWLERFSGTIHGLCRLHRPQPLSFVSLGQEVLASEFFDQIDGEDSTGVALFGWFLSTIAKSPERWPAWLKQLAAYEYLLTIAFPRWLEQAEAEPGLESELFPQAQRFQCQEASEPGQYRLVKELVFCPFDYPISYLQEVLDCGGDIDGEVEPEPEGVLFVLEPDGAIELEASYPYIDILQLCVRPQSQAELEAMFPDLPEAQGLAQVLADLEELGCLEKGALSHE